MNKLKHGGKRRGAGRNRINNDLQKRRNISLSDEHCAKAVTIGGNVSEGIRIALDECYENFEN